MRGLILDGVTGSGKTRVLHELRRSIADANSFDSQIWLDERVTDRILEDDRRNGAVCGKTVKSHMDRVIDGIDHFNGILRTSKFGEQAPGAVLPVFIERLILSQLAHPEQPRCGHEYTPVDIHDQFSRLRGLGFIQVILVVPEARLRDAVLSTTSFRGECWANFLTAKGDSDAVFRYFSGWQKRLLEHAAIYASSIPTIQVTVEDGDFGRYAREIRGHLHV